jgi:aryl-alcohol dehydrogenase-like predicted oxidoreductase
MESPWAEPVDPRCQPGTLARGGGRQPEETAPRPARRLPVAHSRSGGTARRVDGDPANLQSEGKIRLVGLSNVTVEHIERARKIVPIVSVQNRYSFADREWDNVVDYCERDGIAFIPWFPLGAGRVAGKLLERIAKARQVKPIQIALAWLLKRSPVMLPIPGTSSIAHLEENIQAASLQLSGNEYRELTGITELAS